MAIGWQQPTYPADLSSGATIDSGELGLAPEPLPRIGLGENQAPVFSLVLNPTEVLATEARLNTLLGS